MFDEIHLDQSVFEITGLWSHLFEKKTNKGTIFKCSRLTMSLMLTRAMPCTPLMVVDQPCRNHTPVKKLIHRVGKDNRLPSTVVPTITYITYNEYINLKIWSIADSDAKFQEPELIFDAWKPLFFSRCRNPENTLKMIIFYLKGQNLQFLVNNTLSIISVLI